MTVSNARDHVFAKTAFLINGTVSFPSGTVCPGNETVDAPTVSNAGVPVSRAKETVPGIRNGLMVWTGLD